MIAASGAVAPGLLGLDGRAALVTGGARSIGRGCAVQLARAGCHVAIADLGNAGSVVAEIESLGRRALHLEVDVSERAQVERMVSGVVEELGSLDVAVNSVGGTSGPAPFLELSPGAWHEVFDRNVTTTFLCCQAEARAMTAQADGGSIVNVASMSGLGGAPNLVGYGAANASVIQLTRSVALELARDGVRVNCIVPGTHRTETVEEAADGGDPELAEWIRTAGKAPPMGRLGDPLEAGGVAVFLASRLSSYVTGHAVPCDGGLAHTTARPSIGGAS